MKNTMKIKSLLSFFVPAAMMSLAVAGCSDYDNGYSEQAIKFAQDFRKTFGDIDPEQDWNLAERGTVTVSTMKESEVKIYAKMGDEYAIVGDYEGVKGTRMLGFDMVEGTKEIVVTDGATAQKTVPGGVVTFGGTRTVRPDGTYGDVTITKLTGDVEINGETFPQYRTYTNDEVQGMLATVPQSQNNIAKVTSDFTYVSTGSFIIYPFFWYTGSENTLGVYYTDANGNYHEVDIYESKGSRWNWSDPNNTGELWYSMGETNVVTDDFESSNPQGGSEGDANAGGWTRTKIDGNCQFKVKTDSNDDQNDASGIVAPFMEIWRENTIGTITLEKEFTVSKNNVECIVEVSARLRNQAQSTIGGGQIIFSANGASVDITASGNNTTDVYNNLGNLYTNQNGTKKVFVKCTSDSNGKIKAKFELKGVDANWFSFKDLKITSYNKNVQTPSLDAINTPTGKLEFPGVNPIPFNGGYGGSDDVYAAFYKGQGIRVDIPAGTKFGMYIKKIDGETPYTIYSEGTKNENNPGLVGDNGEYSSHYASTFYVGDKMFIGFEDWPGSTGGDYDLNDLVLAFSGAKPTIINEDPTATVWLVACEDLGGSFDIDYNDVVFSVEHVSGKTKAKLTPLAAGGTLASYIYFQDPWDSERDKCFGEIHQLFGATKVKSGEFSIINAKSRYEKTAAPIEFEVDENWTMAYYATGDGSGSAYTRNGKDVNMGGFEVRTLKSGSDAPYTLPINSDAFSGASKIQPSVRNERDNVPYILCIPYSYTRYNYPEAGKKADYVWAWPVEYMTICDENGAGPYPDFAGWVQDHKQNTDWYKNKNNDQSSATVEDLILSTGAMTQEEINANGGGNAQQFGHSNEVVNVNRAISLEALKAAMKANLTGTSSSDIKYYYKDDNGNWTEITGPFWVARERDVKAEQDGNSTEFKLNILKDQLGNKGSITITKGETVNLVNNLTGYQGNGTFTLGYNGNSLDFDSEGWDKTKFEPTSTGKHTVTVTQTGDNDHEAGSTTFDLIVKEANGGGQTFNVPGTISSAVFTIENGSNGKYNVKYNGNTILTNVSSVKFSWSDIKTSDGSGNPMNLFTPTRSLSWSDTSYQANNHSVNLGSIAWNGDELRTLELNPYHGSFTLTVTGQ